MGGDAAQALGNIGPAANAAIPALIELCRDDNPSTRREAAEALGKVGSTSATPAPILITLLDDDPEVTIAAIDALAKMSTNAKEAVPALRQKLSHDWPRIQISAAFALLEIDPVPRKDLVPALAYALRLGDEDEASRATIALAKLGPGAAGVIPDLEEIIDRFESDKRKQAAMILIKLTPGADGSLQALVRTLENQDPNIRKIAAEALGNLGTQAQAAVPRLTQLLQDDEPEIRAAAGQALKKINPDVAND